MGRMPRFYTGKGDDGYTSRLGGGRAPKYAPQVEAVGLLDEAAASLGVARAACQSPLSGPLLLQAQRDLYTLMTEIAASPENAGRFARFEAERVDWLEAQIDALNAQVEMPAEFIVAGDSSAQAALDLARTVVRRAERRATELLHNHLIDNPQILRYLNRLSSLCFALELLENQAAGRSNPTLAKG